MRSIVEDQMPAEASFTAASSMMGVFDMVRAGLGLALLPVYLARHCETVVEVEKAQTDSNWEIWLLAHPDVRRSARVNAFYDFVARNATEHLFKQS